MNQNECFELLVYMVTSAAGLEGEPRIYGPLRMIEASQRLCNIMIENNPEAEYLKELIDIIENGKGKASSDENGFYQMLQEAVSKLADSI